MRSGILIINKEKDMTSRDVVNDIVKKLSTKKVGHTGTLDPIATGVLVLGINEGTKIIELLTSNDKEYVAEVYVGIQTDTLDITGKTVDENNNYELNNQMIINALNHFKGKYMQTVPIYSAVKINGKKLYEYARENIDIELPKREIEIKDIELINGLNNNTFSFKVNVSKGTYIRSLIDDIGMYLGIPMTMKELNRIRQGIFNIDEAIKLEEVNENKVISISNALNNLNRMVVDDDTAFKIKNGCKINKNIDSYTLIFDKNNNLLAIYEPDTNINIMKPYRVFNEV